MRPVASLLLFLSVMVSCLRPGSAAHFTSEELFRIPFGESPEALGARIADGNFSFPRDFAIDAAGRFYIYDTLKHRIARYSPGGKFELGFRYPETAGHVFAHPDARENLWLLISDPGRGLFYGVYDRSGKALRDGVFAQYNQFRLHVDDDAGLHVIVSSSKRRGPEAVFILDEASLLMKKENIPRPPEAHHEIRRDEKRYFIDAVPGNGPVKNRITDESRRGVAEIPGQVIYMSDRGGIYTRTGACDLQVYELDGSLRGRVTLPGLESACAAIRFDSAGTIYELDGIPDGAGRYGPEMRGMRLIQWTLH
jgi:hypothetical protein